MILRAHPYADKFPMLPEPELAELAESIRTNGLRNPVVVTTDGLILDGRNRAAACERVGVEPETVVYDGDDLAEYVIDCNVTRRNMSTGARAMSTALVLAEAGLRSEGKWDGARSRSVIRGSSSTNSESAWVKALTQCGAILDHAPDLAPAVVDGTTALHDAYQRATERRDAAEREAQREAAAIEAEAEARDFIQAKDPQLAATVGGPIVQTYREAVAIWEQRNAAEVAERRQREADHRAAVGRYVGYLRAFLSGVHLAAALADDPLRDDTLAALHPTERDRFLRIEKEASWPTTI